MDRRHYVKVGQNGRIVSVAAIVAVGVNSDVRREVLDMDFGPSEAETFWTAFLRKLARRGLRGVNFVVSDAHEGIKATVAKVLNASWQRRRVGVLKNRDGADSLHVKVSRDRIKGDAGMQGTRATRTVHHQLATPACPRRSHPSQG
nr:transposase for insertion sequence element IS256 in transposon Tn4001 [Bradyrhizobium sp. DOA9]